MRIGDVVLVTNLTVRRHVPKGASGPTSIYYAARQPGESRRKGETPVFALLVLGRDTLEAPTLSPDEVLKVHEESHDQIGRLRRGGLI